MGSRKISHRPLLADVFNGEGATAPFFFSYTCSMEETWTNSPGASLPKWLEGRSMRMPGGELIVAVTSVDGEAPTKFNVRIGQSICKNSHGVIAPV